MKNKEDKENIFQVAAGKGGKIPLTASEEREVDRFKSLFPKLEKRPLPPGAPLLSPKEQQQAFERAKAMHEEIKKKIEDVFTSNQVTPKRLQEYLSTSSNFRKSRWRAMQEEKKILQEKLSELSPQKEATAEPQKEAPTEEPTPASPKPKTKGLLKKSRWMPMR